MAVESDDRAKLRRQRYSVPYSTFRKAAALRCFYGWPNV
jgi:hypothetical protein